MAKIIFFILTLFTSRVVCAGPAPAPSPPPKNEKLDKMLVEKDKEITKNVDSLASIIDVALAGGKKIVNTANVTKVIIRNQLNWPEGGPITFVPHFDLRLHMPNLEKKWQLKFTSYDVDQDRGINRNRVKTNPVAKDYAGSVGLQEKLGNVNAEFEPRFEFRNQILLSYFLKFTNTSSTKVFSVHPELQFFARSDSGVGQFFSANIDVPLYKTLALTLIDEEQYLDQVNVFSANNGISLGYEYTDRLSQSYTLLFESSSRPNYHLDRYTVSTGFTHKLYKNVLHYTVMPYLAFGRGLDFKGSPGINLELDIIF